MPKAWTLEKALPEAIMFMKTLWLCEGMERLGIGRVSDSNSNLGLYVPGKLSSSVANLNEFSKVRLRFIRYLL